MNIENDNLWYPYCQMKNRKQNFKVISAEGIRLKVLDSNTGETKELIDTISSWWCVVHGYNNPEINEAITNQLNKFAHVMLGGLTHKPAEVFAKKLVEITPENLNHVFFSDSGSVGVEVALKMAIQYFANKGQTKTKFVSLTHSYHGDTFKAMEVGDDPDYHMAFSSLFDSVFHVSQPKGGFNADSENIEKAVLEFEKVVAKNHNEIAAFIVEPILQAAGGMNFYSPKYLNEVNIICKKYDILLIFDEVATGFGRTGKMFAMNYCDFTPDIVVLGKALTAGYTGHAATLTTSKIFEAFYDNDPEKAFMHGPTFMGNPLACVAGLKSLELYEKYNYIEKIKKIETVLKENLTKIESNNIKEIRVLGGVGVIEIFDSSDFSELQDFAYKHGVWIRPFIKYIYLMPPYVISEQELLYIIEVIKEWFEE